MSNTSPRSVAHDFARFDKIFGGLKNRNQKSSKRNSNQNQNISNPAKRKSNLILCELPVEEPNVINEEPNVINEEKKRILTQDQSSDKNEILQFLSAQENNFKISEKASSRLGNGDLSGKLEEVLTNSPDIGEFSEDEEKDAHREQIAMTNHKLIEIRKKKLEYRAKHKIVKGGLFEKIHILRGKLEGKAVSFVRAKENLEGQQRIEIVHQSQFRKRAVMRFKFVNLQHDEQERETRRFLVAPAAFKFALKIQSSFDVIFDLPEQQICENPKTFLHFASWMIKAGR